MNRVLTCLLAIFITSSASAESLNMDLNCVGKIKIKRYIIGNTDVLDNDEQDWTKQVSIRNNEYEGHKLAVTEFQIKAREEYKGGVRYSFILDRYTGELEKLWFGRLEPFDYFFKVRASCELMNAKTRKF